eukprot:GHVH01000167.1.p1 GENE.GHVH01000167.1~~GHVH01000167.1.p1  ORF type:complete len:263 (+),score=41.31 GHVH01000167.1:109-897(+)
MFEARLSQGATLKKVFESVKELCADANIEVTESGLELQAMDHSHVSMVRLEIKRGAFDHYRCERPRSLGLNMGTVVKVMKMCSNEDVVTLRHHEDSDSIEFCFENENERKTSSFKMKLMVIDDERMILPDLAYDAKVTMSTRLFTNVIAQMSQFADIIQIHVNKSGTLEFSASSDQGQASTSYSPNDGDQDVQVKSDSNVKSGYGARFLNLFSKAAPVSSQVTLNIGHNQPLLVVFELNDDPDHGSLNYFLAPKQTDECMEE